MTTPIALDMVCMFVASAPGTGTIPLGTVLPFGGVVDFHGGGATDGGSYYYYIQDGNNREFAWGIYSASGLTITRNTVTASVNGVQQSTPINATANAIISSMISNQSTAANLAAIQSNINTVQSNLNSAQSSLQTQINDVPGGYINKFRNPGMDVAQRGTSGSVASGSTAYTFDGWMVAATGAAAAWSQVYNANIAGNALRLSCASGLTACTVKQRIESFIAAQLLAKNKAAQQITVEFTIYNNSGASITPQLATGYASARDNFATFTSDLAAINLQSIANGAVGTVAYTFTPNANLANGYEVQLQFGGALNASSGYVGVSLADIRVTIAASAGLNSTPPTPELRPYHTEWLFAQRYLPGFSGNGQWGFTTVTGAGGCTFNYFIQFQFFAPTRVAPTGLSQNNTAYAIVFSSASQFQFVSTTQNDVQSPSPWGGTSASSWAVLTGAEL